MLAESGAFLFEPFELSVPSGSRVTWSWSGDVPHNVTIRSLGLASATDTSLTYTATFTTPGTYEYVCTIHEASRPVMRGRVIVR